MTIAIFVKKRYFCETFILCQSTIPLTSGFLFQWIHWHNIAPILQIFIYLEMYFFGESIVYFECIPLQKIAKIQNVFPANCKYALPEESYFGHILH